MKIEKVGFPVFFLWGVAIIACGGAKKGSQGLQCASFLPDSLIQGGIERSSEIRTYSGESLFEYIDGGAELYHQYGFVEVATANYRGGEIEVIVDIYGFDTADHAYGLYASLRPPDADLVSFGVEGFATTSSTDFVKGNYVVHLIGFDESGETQKALESLASEIDGTLPGEDYLPESFSLFPLDDAVAASDMIYAESFVGHEFLTDVYVRKYLVDGDSLTLFLTEDRGGGKFSRWFELGAADGSAFPGNADLPFDEGRVFELDHSYYGTIICGLKGERLLGAIGYRDETGTFLSKWLHSLP